MTVDAAPLQAADLVVKSTAEAGLPARVLGPGSGQGQYEEVAFHKAVEIGKSRNLD